MGTGHVLREMLQQQPEAMFMDLVAHDGVLPSAFTIGDQLLDRNGYHMTLKFEPHAPALAVVAALLEEYGCFLTEPNEAKNQVYVLIRASRWNAFKALCVTDADAE